MGKRTSYIIAGPTASGKSAFAHSLAEEIGGTIINCDSVQIYRGIEIISANPFANKQPKKAEIGGIPYRLYSAVSLAKQISVADYLTFARREYSLALLSGRVPIFVGGTGYYINVLTEGLSPMPPISPMNRKRARDLVKKDIGAARKLLPPDFKATDPQRISRALEIFFETGRHITDWQQEPRIGAILPTPYKILINPDMRGLQSKIRARIKKMIEAGAKDEARKIIDLGRNENRAIGEKQLCLFLRGEISESECIETWVRETNQYAKRQKTWFKNQFVPDIELKSSVFNPELLSGESQ